MSGGPFLNKIAIACLGFGPLKRCLPIISKVFRSLTGRFRSLSRQFFMVFAVIFVPIPGQWLAWRATRDAAASSRSPSLTNASRHAAAVIVICFLSRDLGRRASFASVIRIGFPIPCCKSKHGSLDRQKRNGQFRVFVFHSDKPRDRTTRDDYSFPCQHLLFHGRCASRSEGL